MKYTKFLVTIVAVLVFALKSPAQRQPVEYVNPYIGTDKSNHPTIWEANGATFPGVLAPYGMVQIAPDDYFYSHNKINSFSFLNHHSGWSSKGNFHLMAFTGKKDSVTDKGSSFSHLNEKATPYYYRVELDDSIKAEFTATPHTGFVRFTFPKSDSSQISLSDISEVRLVNDSTIEGESGEYFFIAHFNKKFKSCNIKENQKALSPSSLFSKTESIVFDYATKENEFIDIKVAFSINSFLGAKTNLATELPSFDFDKQIKNNRKVWSDKLKRIEVKGGSEDQKTIFYTALYHSFFMPSVISDADAKTVRYSPLYPWDTYRSKHPLFTIIDPERQAEMISSVLAEADKTGWLPTGNMMGNHNIQIIVDSYVKGIRNFDVEKALKVMRKSLMEFPYARREMAEFVQYGYVPGDITSSVTHTLEFAYDNWALAEFIRVTGKIQEYKNDYDTLLKRAHYYINQYNPESGFMEAKDRNKDWADAGYCEGTKWTYSWYVSHDVNGLVNLMGGKRKFSSALTECFEKGYYVHDNEPPLHYAYLYNYVGEPWKTQKWSRKILNEYYSNTPGGIPGNDDLGAMSSWYVLSAMGFYPVTPGEPIYEIGSPVFDEVIIHQLNGKNFTIRTNNNSDKNVFIQSATIDGEPLNRPWITQQDIIDGKTLLFKMAAQPNEKWGTESENAPPSMTKGYADFSFTNCNISSEEAQPDVPFNISVVVQNKGEATGSVKLSITVDGKPYKVVHEIMKAGDKRKLTYPLTLYSSGDHQVAVNGLKAKILRVADQKARFTYSQLTIPQPPLIKIRDSLVVSAIVKNTGGTKGIAGSIFYVNAKEMNSKKTSLKPGQEVLTQFVFREAHEGVFDVAIGDVAPLKIRVLPDKAKRVGYTPPTNLHPALVLDFDEADVKVVKDLSGRANDAIVEGNIKWVDGIFGKAIQTDALNNAYLKIPQNNHLDEISNGKTLTMMCWIYPMDEENFADIFCKGDWNTLQVKGGNSVVNYYTGGWEGHESSATVPKGWNHKWHHVAGVTVDGYLKLYVDGNLLSIKKAEPRNPNGETGTGDYSDKPWNIGRNASSPERVFKGYIDDVILFETALTKEQIFEVMMHIKK